ncbi:MAG TPA: deoxyribodipyrimidine photo-lyase [Solirubrobacteraceae bacterium]|jgi:deoxyribodipyrimidine photo-lyase|nr:deoxyribodipyrimidine photo-lyase [Solirubrobacteraceae bacterium]
MSTALLWFRRDLRLHDHPALRAARDGAERLVCVFCFDDALLKGRHASGPRTQFMLECLQELDEGLRARGSRLFVRHGNPADELAALAGEVHAASLHFSADVGPFARRRQQEVKRALEQRHVKVIAHPGLFAVDGLEAIRTSAGDPYTVFTPFYTKWLSQPRREVVGVPRSLPAPGTRTAAGTLPTLGSLGLEQELSDPMPGGEAAAREALWRFLAGPVDDYEDARNVLTGRSVSRLSPYLHFGAISPREIEERLGTGPGAEAFRRQICWRDFYAHVLGHFPANAKSEFQERYRGMRWSRAETRFAAWCEGRTGYPAVDAGMRQLRREGWIHNRARLVVGSFLTKDLGIDWRWGERWFMRLLLDGDQASNNGNWQWIASVGVDPAPAFRRIFNPARQQKQFDPGGDYVREYVRELAGVPDAYLAEPWTMPADVQERCGCMIGRDYPEPIVDHAEARRQALDRYRIKN